MIPIPGRGYGMIGYAPGRRQNRKYQMEQVRQAHLDQQLRNQFKRQEFERALQSADDRGFPKEITELLRLQMEGIMPPELPDLPTDEELNQQELEGLAEQFSGSYIEKKRKGVWKAWDFRGLLMNAISAEYIPVEGRLKNVIGEPVKDSAGDTGPDLYLTLSNGDELTLEGDVAIAFVRYLHYQGLFRMEKAKKPCPNCGDKEPQDCETCGGLGWVIAESHS